jgi:hypothetical protein
MARLEHSMSYEAADYEAAEKLTKACGAVEERRLSGA